MDIQCLLLYNSFNSISKVNWLLESINFRDLSESLSFVVSASDLQNNFSIKMFCRRRRIIALFPGPVQLSAPKYGLWLLQNCHYLATAALSTVTTSAWWRHPLQHCSTAAAPTTKPRVLSQNVTVMWQQRDNQWGEGYWRQGMAYDVKLGSGFRLDSVDNNPVDIQQTINASFLIVA